MPSQSRIDALGVFHPIIIRGMERRVIFRELAILRGQKLLGQKDIEAILSGSQ